MRSRWLSCAEAPHAPRRSESSEDRGRVRGGDTDADSHGRADPLWKDAEGGAKDETPKSERLQVPREGGVLRTGDELERPPPHLRLPAVGAARKIRNPVHRSLFTVHCSVLNREARLSPKATALLLLRGPSAKCPPAEAGRLFLDPSRAGGQIRNPVHCSPFTVHCSLFSFE